MTVNTDDIVALALKRVRPLQIAERFGIPVGRVYSRLSQARREGIDIPRFTTNGLTMAHKGSRHVVLPLAVADALAERARQYEMSQSEFAAALLSVIVEDNLFDAVFDDADFYKPVKGAFNDC